MLNEITFSANITSNLDPDFSLITELSINDEDLDPEFYMEELELTAICHALNKGQINLMVDGDVCYLSSKNFKGSFILPLNKDLLVELEEEGSLDDFALEEALYCGHIIVTIS
jgi:hypothetical protein